MIDADLLKILCCPETRQPLTLAEGSLLQRLNDQIAKNSLLNRAGKPVTRPCDGGLLRKDGQFVYPICAGIPILLIDESIPVVGQ
ncbi:MAG: hypothetical protein IPK15_15860 [Verrucomicrobia bacterium]|jgi:uncharacterized protein|nr:hypothetical protein [Verrucomicrobiota bacterium]